MKQYMITNPRVRYRTSVREPLDPRIHVSLHELVAGPPPWEREQAEAQLTVPQALDLILSLTRAVQDFTARGDIRKALHRTEPYSTEEA